MTDAWRYVYGMAVLSLVTRVRALLLLLAFSVGLLGYGVAGFAVAAQKTTATLVSANAILSCPDGNRCGGGDMAAGSDCAIVFCWNVPALPSQNAPVVFLSRVVFVQRVPNLGRGISPSPDPGPPRSSPYA